MNTCLTALLSSIYLWRTAKICYLLSKGREQLILGKRPQYVLFSIYGERPIIFYGTVGERPRTINTWQTTTACIVYCLWRTANIWYCWQTAENNQYLANDHSLYCLLFMANGQYMVLLANGREQSILGKKPQHVLFIIYDERPIILYGIVGERPRTVNTWQTTTIRIVYYLWRTANNMIWYCWQTAENNQYLAKNHSMYCLLFMTNGQ